MPLTLVAVLGVLHLSVIGHAEEELVLDRLHSELASWPSFGTYHATGRNEFFRVHDVEHAEGMAYFEALVEEGLVDPELMLWAPPFANYLNRPHRVVEIDASAVLAPTFKDVEYSYVDALDGRLYAIRSYSDGEASVYSEYIDGQRVGQQTGSGDVTSMDIFIADLRTVFARTGFYWDRLTEVEGANEGTFHARLLSSELHERAWGLNAPKLPAGVVQYTASLDAVVELAEDGGWSIRHHWVDPLGSLVASTVVTSDGPGMRKLSSVRRRIRPGSQQVLVDLAWNVVQTGGVAEAEAKTNSGRAGFISSRLETRFGLMISVDSKERAMLPLHVLADLSTTGVVEGAHAVDKTLHGVRWWVLTVAGACTFVGLGILVKSRRRRAIGTRK
jgi:hypothetical protein